MEQSVIDIEVPFPSFSRVFFLHHSLQSQERFSSFIWTPNFRATQCIEGEYKFTQSISTFQSNSIHLVSFVEVDF